MIESYSRELKQFTANALFNVGKCKKGIEVWKQQVYMLAVMF